MNDIVYNHEENQVDINELSKHNDVVICYNYNKVYCFYKYIISDDDAHKTADEVDDNGYSDMVINYKFNLRLNKLNKI